MSIPARDRPRPRRAHLVQPVEVAAGSQCAQDAHDFNSTHGGSRTCESPRVGHINSLTTTPFRDHSGLTGAAVEGRWLRGHSGTLQRLRRGRSGARRSASGTPSPSCALTARRRTRGRCRGSPRARAGAHRVALNVVDGWRGRPLGRRSVAAVEVPTGPWWWRFAAHRPGTSGPRRVVPCCQRPPIEPDVRFSLIRLSDIVHLRHAHPDGRRFR